MKIFNGYLLSDLLRNRSEEIRFAIRNKELKSFTEETEGVLFSEFLGKSYVKLITLFEDKKQVGDPLEYEININKDDYPVYASHPHNVKGKSISIKVPFS